MKLEPWEPDLRTLLSRVREGELDLQPDFQRGLAWNGVKQQRLVDTILRGWSVPPLHLLVLPDEKLAVLDGQQRLRAAQEFVDHELKVGAFEPYDEEIRRFTGLTFKELPEAVQRRVNNFKVSCYRLYEYEAAEPYELFFRLNLPTGLTQAEKRNALVGDSREQVKHLLREAVEAGWTSDTVGFANTRMAYDDTLARACIYVENRTLRQPLTAGELETQYRNKGGFSASTTGVVSRAVIGVARAFELDPFGPKLNKATLLTWLLAYCRLSLEPSLTPEDLARVLVEVERGRVAIRRPGWDFDFAKYGDPRVLRGYLELYNDRASSRVTDVLSVTARDLVVWRLAQLQFPGEIERSPKLGPELARLARHEKVQQDLEWHILRYLEQPESWGELA